MTGTESLLRLLQQQYPILQAPMAGVATPELAAAVSGAGALGGLGIGSSSPAKAREMIAATRALTDRPFNVNVFCHRAVKPDATREAEWLAYLRPFFAEFDAAPPERLTEIYTSFIDSPETFAMLRETRPAVVSFHFGLPPVAWIEALRESGIVTLACVTTPGEAAEAEAAGVDALIAQGAEAGGHRGVFEPGQGDARIGTFSLVRLLARQVGLPVIAAGGIMDGAGIAAALQLGAAGVQLGTAFLLCPEAATKAAHRARLKSKDSQHTEITRVISGRPARGIINRMHTDIDRSTAPALPGYPQVYDGSKALSAAASAQGSDAFAAQWAGQGAPLVRELPAGVLVAELVREWHESRLK